jgi:hypothetical protein
LSSLARSFFAVSSISINQAKSALHFFQGVRLAAACPEIFKAISGNDYILNVLALRAIELPGMDQGPCLSVGQDILVLRSPMRVDPVPSVPSESVPALRTHLPLGARFTRLDQTVILFNQPERGVLNQLGWRNTCIPAPE